MVSRLASVTEVMSNPSATQNQEKTNGRTAGVGPGEKGLSHGARTSAKIKNRAMWDGALNGSNGQVRKFSYGHRLSFATDHVRNIKTWAKQEDGKRIRSFKLEVLIDGSLDAVARVPLNFYMKMAVFTLSKLIPVFKLSIPSPKWSLVLILLKSSCEWPQA